MSLPTYQAAGAVTSGTGNVTPALPTHLTNDVFLLFAEYGTFLPPDTALAAPSGWALVSGGDLNTGDVGGRHRFIVFWKRAASASETNPTLLDAGDHIIARVLSFRGCITTGNPWNVTASNVESAVSDTAVSIPGDTTTVADCLVVLGVSSGIDTLTSQVSGWTNGSLSSLTERTDDWTDQGNGGGFAVATGGKATLGTYSTTTATLATTARQCRISIALKPPAAASLATPGTGALTITGQIPSFVAGGNNPVFQAAGTAVHGTGDVSPAWPTHAIGDIGLLFIETANQAVSAPAGWLEIVGSPQGHSVSVPTRITVFWNRATSTSMSAPTLVDPGDHIIAQILTFRGGRTTGSPWNALAGAVKSDAATTSVTMQVASTTEPNTLVVAVVAAGTDTTSAQATAWAGTGLTSVTEQSDSWTTDGNGGGFAIATGVKTSFGLVGPITATLATAARYAYIWISLGPAEASSGAGSTQTPHQFWRLKLLNTPGAGPECNEVEIVTRDGTAAGAGSTIDNPAKMHPGVTHIRPMFASNWNNGADPTGEWDIDRASMTLPAGYVPSVPGDEVRRGVDTLLDADGVLKPGVRQNDGAGSLPLVKGTIRGTAKHGDVILFATYGRTFLTVPKVVITGGIMNQGASKWGTIAAVDGGTASSAPTTTKPQYDDALAGELNESGFTMHARLRQPTDASISIFGLAFPTSNLKLIDETATISTLTGWVAGVDRFFVRVDGSANLKSYTGSPYVLTYTYLVETSFNSGGSWQGRSTGVIAFETQSTTYVSQTVVLYHNMTVPGLTSDGTDQVRVRIIDVTEQGTGTYDPAFTSIQPSNAAVYGSGLSWVSRAEIFASKTPDSGDYVEWEATGYV